MNSISIFSIDNRLMDLSKDKASQRKMEALVFKPNYINDQVNAILNVGGPHNPWQIRQYLLDIRNRVIEEQKMRYTYRNKPCP